ncbi:hypothetical protein R1sor_004328 [Riccia sorocarpa]|uniref:Uncharacterized protein n=1 Tax=Riccia sorocarpa TaxID=122646 RepID=A0ABD3HGM4_9MARC
MTQLAHEDYQANKWRPSGKPGGHRDRPLDEENVPPNLDYKVLEQIADGVEKMIISWSNAEDREPYLPPCMKQAMESVTSPPASAVKELPLQGQAPASPMKSPLSEKSFTEDGGCNNSCPVQFLQEGFGGVTTAISGTGPARLIASSADQTGRRESNANKEGDGEMKDGKGPPHNLDLTVTKWKDDTDARSSIRTNSDEWCFFPGNDAEAPATMESQQQKSSQHPRRSSRGSRKKERILSKRNHQQPYVTPNNTTRTKQETEDQSRLLQTQAKHKTVQAEVSLLPKVNTGNLNSLFKSIVIDDELLEKKLEALTTMPPTPLLNPVDLPETDRNKQVQDLQIALLECAMEYELKTIELKMKIKSLQSTPKHTDPDSKSLAEKAAEQHVVDGLVQSKKPKVILVVKFLVRCSRCSIQEIRGNRKLKFETQQRSLDDAICRVNRLTKEVLKKEHGLTEAQLLEKQLRAQLQETEEALAKAEASRLPTHQGGLEPAKLVAALPSLREWIRHLKKDNSIEPLIVKMVDGYYSPGEETDHPEAVKPRSTNDQAADTAHKVVERVVHNLMKEVQGLQRELGRLGSCRTVRPKSAPLSGEFLKAGHLKKERVKK